MSWEAQAQDIVTGDSIVEELEVLYEVWAELDWRLPDTRAKTLVRSTCGVFYHAQMAFDGYPGWPQVFRGQIYARASNPSSAFTELRARSWQCFLVPVNSINRNKNALKLRPPDCCPKLQGVVA